MHDPIPPHTKWIAETINEKHVEDDNSGRGVKITTESPMVEKGLTTYADAEIVDEVAIPGAVDLLHLAVNPFEPEDLGTVMSRSYLLITKPWTSSNASGDVFYMMHFPRDLLDVPQIARLLPYYKFFKCDAVKVTVRVNATEFHYGMLALSHVVGQLNNATSYALHDYQMTQRLNNYPAFVSASGANVAEYVIEWHVPYALFNLGTMNNEEFGATLARVTVDVPVVLSMAGPAVNPVEVSIFAEFVNPKLIFPTFPPAEFQSGTVESFWKAVKGVAADVNSVVTTVEGHVKKIADIGTKLAPMAAMVADKPTTVAAPTLVSPGMLRDLVGSEGVDNSQFMGWKVTSVLGSDDGVIDKIGGCPTITSVAQMPAYVTTYTFNSDTASGTTVAAIPVQVGYYASVPESFVPTYVDYMAAAFQFWRGSIMYGFYVSCAKVTTCRVRISFVPTDEAIPDVHGGDVLSQVVDISGDTFIPFVVPYTSSTGWLNVLSGTAPQRTGYILVTLLNKVVSTDAASVHMMLYKAGGADFQLAAPNEVLHTNQNAAWALCPAGVTTADGFQSNPNVDFANTDFFSFGANQGVELNHICQTEVPPDLVSMLKRYVEVVTNDTEIPFSTQGVTDNVWTMPLIILTATGLSLVGIKMFRYFGMLFQYWRGNTRMKLLFDPNYPAWVHYQYRTGAIAPKVWACVPKQPYLEVEIPYHSPYAFQSINGDFESNIYHVWTDSPAPERLLVAAGDDFQLGGLYSPPVLHFAADWPSPPVLEPRVEEVPLIEAPPESPEETLSRSMISRFLQRNPNL